MTTVPHGHCPDGCEHPQPISGVPTKPLAELLYLDPSREHEFCGRCWVRFGELVPMAPCAPEICGGGDA